MYKKKKKKRARPSGHNYNYEQSGVIRWTRMSVHAILSRRIRVASAV